MKKIIIFTIILIFIPFFIIKIFNINNIEEIQLKYINNINVRVKRLETNEIQTCKQKNSNPRTYPCNINIIFVIIRIQQDSHNNICADHI